jgi:polyhydroxybutyrate depolymerase
MRAFFHLGWTAVAVLALHACSEDTPGGAGNPKGSSSGGTSSGGTSSGGTSGNPDDSTPAVPSKVNTSNETISVDGTERNYMLSVPKTYATGRSYPLILALHGDGQDAPGFVTFLRLDAFTGDDAILAYPNRSEDLFTPYEQNNDQRLIEVMIDALKGKFAIDDTKVWALGYSKGAYQLNEIACRKPGLLKAMAIHAGGAPQERASNGDVDCPSAIALPTFVTHGSEDDPGGGQFGADYWASLAGCGESRTPSTPSICEAYDGCSAGKPVVFCVVPGQPHFPLYKDAAEHSWAWFKTL